MNDTINALLMKFTMRIFLITLVVFVYLTLKYALGAEQSFVDPFIVAGLIRLSLSGAIERLGDTMWEMAKALTGLVKGLHRGQ